MPILVRRWRVGPVNGLQEADLCIWEALERMAKFSVQGWSRAPYILKSVQWNFSLSLILFSF